MPLRVASLAVSESTMDTYNTQFRNRRKPLLKIQTETPKRVIRDTQFPLPDVTLSGSYGKGRSKRLKSPKSPKPQIDASASIELGLEEQGVHLATEKRQMKIALRRLDMDIKRINNKIDECRKQRSRFGGAKAYKQAIKKERAELNNWEAAVLMWTTRNNEAAQDNKRRRNAINKLRREKLILDKAFNETRVKLEDIDDSTKKLMKTADGVNKERIRAKNRLEIVYEDHENQMMHIENGIKHVDELVNESRKKSLEIMQNIENMKHDDDEEDLPSKESEDNVNGPGLSATATSLTQSNTRKKTKHRHYNISEYETAFNMLKEESGIEDLFDCIQIFLFEAGEQFKLYKEIQDINEEVEEVGHQRDQILKKFLAEQEEEEEKNMAFNTKLKGFQDKLDKVKQNNAIFAKRLQQRNTAFDKISNGISSVFTGLGCDVIAKKNKSGGSGVGGKDSRSTATMMEFLGAAITHQNCMRYMGVIEQRAASIIDDYRKRLESEGKDVSAFKHFIASPTIKTGTLGRLMKIDSPTMKEAALGDGYESKAEKAMLAAMAAASNSRDDVPHTREELRRQYELDMKKKAKKKKNPRQRRGSGIGLAHIANITKSSS
jgi:hypothetical protein